jgi:hypothetical protein
MSKEKEFVAKPIPSDREEKIDRPVPEREFTITMKFRKIALKTFVLLFVFFLGFILSELSYRDRLDGIHFYVFDTEQALEHFYREWERDFFDRTGVSPESLEARERIARVRSERPLVEVGPFVVFVNNDNGEFSVREIQPSMLPLLELKSHEQSKRLTFISSLEKGWKLPRFYAQLFYSEDGIYERGFFGVIREDATRERVYLDTKGTGVFDIKYVFENGVRHQYRLNGLTWERVVDESESQTEIHTDCIPQPGMIQYLTDI